MRLDFDKNGNCCGASSSNCYITTTDKPEKFRYKVGDTLYYINPDKKVFAGVVIRGFIDDTGIVYTVNDNQIVEEHLYRTYRDAELSILKNDFKNYADLLWGMIEEIRESNNKLADFIMNDGEHSVGRRSLSIKIDLPRCFTQHSDNNDLLEKPKYIDVDRLIIRRPQIGEGYNFFFVECDTTTEVYSDNVDYEKGLLAINDTLKSYINKL